MIGELEHSMLYGLHVASELPLHQDRPAPGGVPDVVVLRGEPLPDDVAPPSGRVLLDYVVREWRMYTFYELETGRGYLLRFHGTCDFRVSADLATVHVDPVPGVDAGVPAILTTGALLAFQLYMRGVAVLHGSAVDVGDTAVGFVGASGMGKSTMATLMCAAGGALVTDDVLRVDVEPDAPGEVCRPRVRLGATELRLRKGADELVDRFAVGVPSRRVSADQRSVLRLANDATDGLPLGAIVVPWPERERGELAVELLPTVEAVFALITYSRLLGWQDEDVVGRHLAQVVTIAQAVPVYRARVPWGPPFATDLVDRLRAAIGLA